MTKKHDAIIHEVLKLYQKYGETEVLAAIQSLRSGQPFSNLANLFSIISTQRSKTVLSDYQSRPAGGTKNGATKKKTPRDYLHEYLEELSRTGDAGSGEVINFIQQIAQRRILESSASLRHFGDTLGVSLSKTKLDRFVAARRIGEALIRLTSNERKQFLGAASEREIGRSSLQGWSDIILKRS